ncbi:flagellar hook-length control protein FliK [Paraphotobacterium marinum]
MNLINMLNMNNLQSESSVLSSNLENEQGLNLFENQASTFTKNGFSDIFSQINQFNVFKEGMIDSEISNVLIAENFNTFKDQLQQTNLISDPAKQEILNILSKDVLGQQDVKQIIKVIQNEPFNVLMPINQANQFINTNASNSKEENQVGQSLKNDFNLLAKQTSPNKNISLQEMKNMSSLQSSDINNDSRFKITTSSILDAVKNLNYSLKKDLTNSSPTNSLTQTITAESSLRANSIQPSPILTKSVEISSFQENKMVQLLQERIQFQMNQNISEAKVRLDPPELGKIDLLVRLDLDKLNIQLNTAQLSTKEILSQISERLKNELINQSNMNVEVNIGQKESSQSENNFEEMLFDSKKDTELLNFDAQSDAFTSLEKQNSESWISTKA